MITKFLCKERMLYWIMWICVALTPISLYLHSWLLGAVVIVAVGISGWRAGKYKEDRLKERMKNIVIVDD